MGRVIQRAIPEVLHPPFPNDGNTNLFSHVALRLIRLW